MKKTKQKNENQKQDSFWRDIFGELSFSILFEIALNILLSIPRLILRFIKAIW